MITLFTTQVEMDCYGNNFLCLPRFKKLAADKHMIADLPLVPFIIINLTHLTAGVCMKVRFKSKVTRVFSFLPFAALQFLFAASRFSHFMWRKIKKKGRVKRFLLQRNP